MREALRGMSRTPYMTLISIVTITVTLTVLGVFAIATLFANGFVDKIRKSEEINVYVKDSLPDEDLLALDAVIASMSEVESTRLLSKEDAKVEFERMFGRDLLPVLDINPLPRTIVVSMSVGHRSADDLENIANRVGMSKGVESVEYGREWMSKLDIFFVFFVIIETVVLSLAAAACVLIVSNTISMTVLARKETIEIMRLVGATDTFIRRPFYFEGLLQGLVSGIASFCVLYVSWRWLHSRVPDLNTYLMMFAYPRYVDMLQEWITAFIIPLGGTVGLIGSFIAVRRVF